MIAALVCAGPGSLAATRAAVGSEDLAPEALATDSSNRGPQTLDSMASEGSKGEVAEEGAVATEAGVSLPKAAGDLGAEPPVSETPPGAGPYPPELLAALAKALAAKGPGYEPRSEHRRPDGGPRFTNRLLLESSPYLEQHAHNPVSWYPWGPEALAKAAREGKPIFLSIGYSTCHWCHVMERESFESLEVARLLNQYFVPIKVDRETRPDLDEVYLTAVQLLSGRGGWPMSVLLTPQGEPFFGGTYLPQPSFVDLLLQAKQAWAERRPQLEGLARDVTTAVREVTAARGAAAEVGEERVREAAREILSRFDTRFGGFGSAPKFPSEPEILLLLEHALRRGDEEALKAADASLAAMARGGIFDQVGGGFHRYSTDERWRVPHFEKMLYTQAQLARAYLLAFQLTGDALHARVARLTLDYVLREMSSPEGTFYSATDADSEGEEGRFFLWTREQLVSTLGTEDGMLAAEVFGVTSEGSFDGPSILFLPRALPQIAADKKLPLPRFLERLEGMRETLRRERETRQHPLRDDKVLTAWNGMMITALAEGAQVLGETSYLEAARRAAGALWKGAVRPDGGLWRVGLDGVSSVPAVLEDHAFLAEGLLTLYDASGDAQWLMRARRVVDRMLAAFWDQDAGGFFVAARDADPHLLARAKSPADGATPSGNSVAVRVLASLAARTGESLYAERAEATLKAFSGSLKEAPGGFAYMLLGADELLQGAAGPRAHGARGKVMALASWEKAPEGSQVAVRIELAPGWHLNSHRPLSPYLIPTSLETGAGEGASGWQLGEVRYPEPREVTLGFQDEPLLVYEGTVTLRASARRGDGESGGEVGRGVLPLSLRLQACDASRCLPPESLLLEMPARPLSGP